MSSTWNNRYTTPVIWLLLIIPWLVFSTTDNSLANLETLQLVQIFFRHGDRSPLSTFPKNEINITERWPTGLGELTPRGKAQAFELGEFIRKRYRTFIRPDFHPGEVRARSSTINRALQTGLGVLGGLYDVKRRGDNDLYFCQTIPTKEDNIIAFSADCPLYEKEYASYTKHREGKQILEQNRDFIIFLSEHTGIPQNELDLWKMAAIFDTLLIQRLHGIPHPEWTTKSYNGGSETHVLMRMSEKAFESITKTPTLMKLRGGPIISEIKKNIETLKKDRQASTEQKNGFPVPQKMFLYSGHDTTVSTLLQALGVYETHHVPYAAAVFVELHKKPAGNLGASCETGMDELVSQDEYYVKVFYRNCTMSPPRELLIPNCSTPPGGCPLSHFYALTHHLHTLDFNDECNSCTGYLSFLQPGC